MIVFRVVDTETTGLEPSDEVVEAAMVDVLFDGAPGQPCHHWQGLFRPSKPIPPESSAIHHITDAMVEGREDFKAAGWKLLVDGDLGRPDYYVAHNAGFDGVYVTEQIRGGVPLLCTYKAALRIWPDAPGFGNQVLRYWLKLSVDGPTEPAHRALPDANVTAHLLVEILKKASVSDLVAWSAQPAVLPRISFGKHAGAQWTELPTDYLEWMVSDKAKDLDPDARWNARHELDRRFAANRSAYVAACCEAASFASTVEDLMSWFTKESDHRRFFGISRDDSDYAAIVAACAARKAQITGTANG